MNRSIIHIHIPAFPIAVARVCRSELRDRPVVVAPPFSERALILHVSLEAKKEGLFKGMPLSKAVKQCPGLKILSPNPGLTERAWEAVTNMAAQYTPLWEPSRPGHIYLDITGTERLWGKAKDTGCRLGREVRARLRLTGAAGVAGNKMVAGIASRVTPSLEVQDVAPGQEAAFMAPLPVAVMPGIGRVRKKILLEELNIRRVRELAALNMPALKLIFGRQGPTMHQRALGIDPTPVYTPVEKPMISEAVTLSQDENDDQNLLAILYHLVERCAHRLRNRELVPKKVDLLIRYTDHKEAKGGVKLTGNSFWDFALYSPLEQLFFKTCHRRIRVRFMRIRFQDLTRPDPQLSLFETPDPVHEKRIAAARALDRIRRRYGEGIINWR